MDRWTQKRHMARARGDREPRDQHHNDYTITPTSPHPRLSSSSRILLVRGMVMI